MDMSLICSPEVDGHFLYGIDQSSMTWSLLLWVWTTLSTLFLSQVHIVGLMHESEGTTFPACRKLKNYTLAAIHSMGMTQTLRSWRNTYRPGLLNLGLPTQYWPSSLSVHGFMTGAGFQDAHKQAIALQQRKAVTWLPDWSGCSPIGRSKILVRTRPSWQTTHIIQCTLYHMPGHMQWASVALNDKHVGIAFLNCPVHHCVSIIRSWTYFICYVLFSEL